jgi:hypothetical protein
MFEWWLLIYKEPRSRLLTWVCFICTYAKKAHCLNFWKLSIVRLSTCLNEIQKHGMKCYGLGNLSVTKQNKLLCFIRFILDDESISSTSRAHIHSCSSKRARLWLIVKLSNCLFLIAHFIFTLVLHFCFGLI